MKELLKGQKTPFDKALVDQPFKIAFKWDQSACPDYEIDSSVLLLSERGKLEEESNFIFYNNSTSACGGLTMDAEPLKSYQKSFNLNLNKLAEDNSRVLFLLTIDNGDALDQRFKSVKNITADIIDQGQNTVLSYKCEDFTNETAIMVLEIYKRNNEWRIQAVGNGFNAGLDSILKEYGSEKVQVAGNEPAPQPEPEKPSLSFDKPEVKEEKQNQETKSQPKINFSKIILDKPGASAEIPFSEFKVTMKWTMAIDLDLHAFYQARMDIKPRKIGFLGRVTPGKKGSVYFFSKGRTDEFPWIMLDRDAGVGNRAGRNEENLFIANLNELEHILIAVNIFGSSHVPFSQFDGMVILKAGEKEIEVPLISKEKGSWCVIAHINNTVPGSPKLININKVLSKTPVITDFI